MRLSPEQEEVLRRFEAGHNVCLIGPGGTGKSMLLRRIVRLCKKKLKLKREQYAIVAFSGMAAMNVKGCTIHSWAGLTPGVTDRDMILKDIVGYDLWEVMNGMTDNPRHVEPLRPAVYKRWSTCKVLIIDESTSFGLY